MRAAVAQVALTTLLAGSLGCSTPPAAAPSTAAWQVARASLRELRYQAGVTIARTLHVRITFHLPGRAAPVTARGILAIAPPHALRMVLLGPGGVTALDLWMNEHTYRLQAPGFGLLREGPLPQGQQLTAGNGELTGGGVEDLFPFAFFEVWFLRPLEGELLDFEPIVVEGRPAMRWYVRSSRGVLQIDADVTGALALRRRIGSGWELVNAKGVGCAHAFYEQPRVGLSIEAECESMEEGASARALRYPGRLGSTGEAFR